MRLNNLELSNIGKFENLKIEFDDLTVLVGANDSGKTTVLTSIQCLRDGKIPPALRRTGQTVGHILAVFECGTRLRLRFDDSGTFFEMAEDNYLDSRVREMGKLRKPQLEELARELTLSPSGTVEDIKQQISAVAEKGEVWVKCSAKPDVLLIDPQDPIPLLGRILAKNVKELIDAESELGEKLRAIQIAATSKLQNELSEGLAKQAASHHTSILGVRPVIDLNIEKLLSLTDLQLEVDSRSELLSNAGSGTRP